MEAAAVVEAVAVVEEMVADRNGLTARYRILIIGGIIAVLLTACSESPTALETVERVDRRNESNYEKVISVGNQPLLRIACRYIGKKPGDPSSYSSSHNYAEIDTAFYEVTFKNLTNSELSVDGVSYRMEKGRLHGKSHYGADSIRRAWGSNIIPAGASITRRNNMVWSREPRNTLIKIYTLRVKHLKSGKRDGIFEAQVPLRYIRQG